MKQSALIKIVAELARVVEQLCAIENHINPSDEHEAVLDDAREAGAKARSLLAWLRSAPNAECVMDAPVTGGNYDSRIVDACARAAHEVNRAYCLALGDTSQPTWDDAPEWQRTSARNGVTGALRGATPQESHESWFAEKAAAGWKFGPVKDPDKKEHPCMVDYDSLPDAQKAKDALYLATVRAMATAMVVGTQ